MLQDDDCARATRYVGSERTTNLGGSEHKCQRIYFPRTYSATPGGNVLNYSTRDFTTMPKEQPS